MKKLSFYYTICAKCSNGVVEITPEGKKYFENEDEALACAKDFKQAGVPLTIEVEYIPLFEISGKQNYGTFYADENGKLYDSFAQVSKAKEKYFVYAYDGEILEKAPVTKTAKNTELYREMDYKGRQTLSAIRASEERRLNAIL